MRIFKYCPPKRNHLSNLKNGELWFRSPNDFNDKQDSNLSTEKIDLKDLVEQYSKDLNEIPVEIIKNLKPPKGLFMMKNEILNSKDILQNFNQDCIGITCFSKNGNSQKMWIEFAQNESGFCLCFETNCDTNFFKGMEKVNYVDTLPIINYSGNNLANELKINYLTKSLYYSFEEEHRLIKFESGPFKFEKICLKEIILGKQITNYTTKRIEKIINENYFHEILIRRNN